MIETKANDRNGFDFCCRLSFIFDYHQLRGSVLRPGAFLILGTRQPACFSVESHRIFRDEPTSVRVVIARTVVINSGLSIELPRRVPQWVGGGPCRRSQLSEGVISVGVCDRTHRSRKRGNGPENVLFVIVRDSRTKFRQRFIYISPMRVLRQNIPTLIDFFQEVRAVPIHQPVKPAAG